MQRVCLALLVAVSACTGGIDPAIPGGLAAGTWGGENAGLIVEDTVAHVHVGCTYGNFRLPAALDRDGRFVTAGEYLLRAYPIAVGPTMPATLEGRLVRDELTFTVTVNDTIARQATVLGPASVTHKKEPRLGPCPICRIVPKMTSAMGAEPPLAPGPESPRQ